MDSEAQKIRQKIGRFRALVIGRPNAGKTTILRCIAQSADGRVDPSTGRGVHDITNELVFSSNPGFVFHDSRGIEAGTTNEMETIQAFISERANVRSLRDKLHAIWYCIPTDNARLVTAAEEQFFDKIDPNGVPVILIFTKFESQESDAFHKLQETCSPEDALLEAPHQARKHFDQKHLHRFMNREYPPQGIVYLKDMHKENAECADILEQTMKALNSDTLKWLLTSVQEVNLKLRIKEMLNKRNDFRDRLCHYTSNNLKGIRLANFVWNWYPHLWHSLYANYYDDDDHHNYNYAYINPLSDAEASFAISPLISKRIPWSTSIPHAFNIKDNNLRALCFVASLVITAEHSFWLTAAKRSDRLNQAAKIYIKSATVKSVSQEIQAAFQDLSSEIQNILGGVSDDEQYESQIALPLADIICNNLLPHKK